MPQLVKNSARTAISPRRDATSRDPAMTSSAARASRTRAGRDAASPFTISAMCLARPPSTSAFPAMMPLVSSRAATVASPSSSAAKSAGSSRPGSRSAARQILQY